MYAIRSYYAFGWKKLSPKAHAIVAWLVYIGSNLSAVWILIANGFMQNPRGYAIEGGRAVLTDRITSYNVCYTKLLRRETFDLSADTG